jgi:hypothetical protein
MIALGGMFFHLIQSEREGLFLLGWREKRYNILDGLLGFLFAPRMPACCDKYGMFWGTSKMKCDDLE